jgi:hypothetical protein
MKLVTCLFAEMLGPVILIGFQIPWLHAERQPDAGFLGSIHTPSGLRPPPGAKPVVIGIVDDAVRVSHEDLRPFIWHNPREIPGNGVDDDGNGMVDDVAGWDVADGKSDVSPPPEREAMYCHGTHLAGIIVQIARRVYGEDAPAWIRILPVKCLASDAAVPYLKDGYKGIRYAADVGADIILASWGVPHASPDELSLLQSLEARGKLLVSSAGNFPQEQEQFPGAFPSALAVSAVDLSGAKTQEANYGGFVDLVAPGTAVRSSGSSSDDAHGTHEGTSVTAAIVAAAAAVVKLQHPGASIEEVTACLKNTAEPVERFQSGDIFYGGKLGAGRLDLAAAAAFDLGLQPAQANSEPHNHQGYLIDYRSHQQLALWRIRPEGEIAGFWFSAKPNMGNPGRSRLKLFQGSALEAEPFLDLSLAEWTGKRFVPGRQVVAMFEADQGHPDFRFLVEYASQSINQSGLYCKGLVRVNTEGIIEDGSGAANYAPRSHCQWLITAPPNKVIQVKFLEFDTEPNTDWVYFFDGAGTQEKIMAAFSGRNLPPDLTTWRNQALLWFVTNDSVQGKGWKAHITFVDPPAIISTTSGEQRMPSSAERRGLTSE